MPWNECLYQYHKKHGGQFLAGQEDDGLLIFSWKDRPLVVDLFRVSSQSGPFFHPQARIPVTLAKPYKLTIGAEKTLSGGMNAVLKVVPNVAGYSSDYGYPEVTKKRLIRSDCHPFTKLVLGSLDLRNALLACPDEKVEVCPGPEGLHLITVTTADALYSFGGDGSWDLGGSGGYVEAYGSEEEKAKEARRTEDEFFPRMDRFLDLTRAVYYAVTQWPMPEG